MWAGLQKNLVFKKPSFVSRCSIVRSGYVAQQVRDRIRRPNIPRVSFSQLPIWENTCAASLFFSEVEKHSLNDSTLSFGSLLQPPLCKAPPLLRLRCFPSLPLLCRPRRSSLIQTPSSPREEEGAWSYTCRRQWRSGEEAQEQNAASLFR